MKACPGANVWAVIAVSTSGFASVLSRPTRRWYVTGIANAGSVPALHEKAGVTVVSGPALGSGASAVTPAGNTAAAATSGRPQPNVVSGAELCVPVFRNAVRMSIGSSVGCICLSSAALAASSGVENDVPSRRPTWPWPVTTHTATPGPVKSGLMRPSAVGPREEKIAMAPSESSAPMASTESPSAGVHTVREPGPLLPAAVTTRMPRCAEMNLTAPLS